MTHYIIKISYLFHNRFHKIFTRILNKVSSGIYNFPKFNSSSFTVISYSPLIYIKFYHIITKTKGLYLGLEIVALNINFVNECSHYYRINVILFGVNYDFIIIFNLINTCIHLLF